MAPPALKNFLLLCSDDGCLAHKPALVVSVSASAGGAYPVAELRMSAGKNTKLCFVPDHVIIRNVANVLNEDEISAGEADTLIRSRLRHSFEMLLQYGRALRAVREHPSARDTRFRFGM
jgi:hypothetical protein